MRGGPEKGNGIGDGDGKLGPLVGVVEDERERALGGLPCERHVGCLRATSPANNASDKGGEGGNAVSAYAVSVNISDSIVHLSGE